MVVADRLMRTPIGLNPFDRAVGPDALSLRRAIWRAAGDDNTITIAHQHYELVRAIQSALIEASEENVAPVNPLAVALAIRFLSTLPPGIPMPEIAVDPYGDIALDWDYDKRRITSVRVSGDGTLHYASLLGHSIIHGSEAYNEMIPRIIIRAIRRVVEPSYR